MDSLIVIHTLILEQNIVMNDSKSMTLGFIEMYYVPVDKTQNNQRLYLTTVLEVHSFLGWAELSLENSALSTMFSVLRAFNYLKQLYEVQFQKIITSKKQEFVSRSKSKETKHNHPVERLFVELGIQYQCTYHTKFHFEKKTNHFFHLLKKDLWENCQFSSVKHFQQELMEYLVYYNKNRDSSSFQKGALSFPNQLSII